MKINTCITEHCITIHCCDDLSWLSNQNYVIYLAYRNVYMVTVVILQSTIHIAMWRRIDYILDVSTVELSYMSALNGLSHIPNKC